MFRILFRYAKLVFFLILILGIPCIFIEQKISIETQKVDMDRYLSKQDHSLFGILQIPKIKVEQPIYFKNDSRNQVDLNVMLLEETFSLGKEHYYMVLASHSGNGIHAYFRNLDQLQVGDSIFFYFEETRQEYQLFKREEVIKQGYVYLEKYAFSYLALITCSKVDDTLQEVYYARLISS